MTHEERERLIRLINEPPPGSKVAEAKAFGIDLTLLVENLEMTPTQRLRALDRAQAFLGELDRHREHGHE